MKLVACFISPRQRLGDIKHTTRFINTVWNENSFQILYIWRLYYKLLPSPYTSFLLFCSERGTSSRGIPSHFIMIRTFHMSCLWQLCLSGMSLYDNLSLVQSIWRFPGSANASPEKTPFPTVKPRYTCRNNPDGVRLSPVKLVLYASRVWRSVHTYTSKVMRGILQSLLLDSQK